MSAPLHTIGMHANHLARSTENPRMQAVLQWVGVGSIIMMGAAAAVHLYKDVCKPRHEWKPEPYPRHKYHDLKDEMDRHERQDRGR